MIKTKYMFSKAKAKDTTSEAKAKAKDLAFKAKAKVTAYRQFLHWAADWSCSLDVIQ